MVSEKAAASASVSQFRLVSLPIIVASLIVPRANLYRLGPGVNDPV